MRVKATPPVAQPDFFQIELTSSISLSHPLVKVSAQIPWALFYQQLDLTYTPCHWRSRHQYPANGLTSLSEV